MLGVMGFRPGGRAGLLRVVAVALLSLTTVARAEVPPGGIPLVSDPLRTFRTSTSRASSGVVGVPGPGFSEAIRVSVDQPGRAWDVELRATITRPVSAGSLGLLRFWARNVDAARSSQAAFTVYAQKASPNWDKAMQVDLAVGSTWQEFVLPWRWTTGYGASGAMIAFGLGRLPQTVEIGGLEILEYTGLALEDLPRTAFTYIGREPDAPWRAAANARIDQMRKAPLTVRVVDDRGNAVGDADVEIRMTRHAFPFGSALVASRLTGAGESHDVYRAHAERLFNAATLENDLKWPPWQGDWGAGFNRPQTLAALAWLKARGFSVRGHVLVWPGWDNLPETIKRHRNTPQAAVMIPTLVLQHIDEITRATAPYVDEWDVVNEPYDNHDLMDLSGWGAMIDWFVRAQANVPAAPRYLNDYGILSSHGADLAHQAYVHEILGWLVAEGAPISGFGMQSHMGASPTSIPRVLEVLDSFAAHGLTIRITEFDLNSDDERLQADYTRDFLTAVFSHPAVAGFQMWGFWEGAHWLPRGAMYRRDWSEKPNGTAYRDLVFDQWQTRGSGLTDRHGRFTARGFYGDYRLVVRRGSRAVEATFRLERGASGEVTVTLPGG